MLREKYRPYFHYSPKENWMNDPNGLVYSHGKYHMFYQYNPNDTVWGPMHWGHAVSQDLIHWQEQGIALKPDELGQIFSGSAVLDSQNTAGFQQDDEDVLVAIFTHHEENNEKQSIAYSNDNGETWHKYENNPVINNPGLSDFRDPKVFWHHDTNRWILLLACGDHIRFYSSPNLKEWHYLSSFGNGYGSKEGVWECPDLIHLTIDGEDKQKWALTVNINPGGPNEGSAVMYFLGDFDGQQFIPDDEPGTHNWRWADYGRDFYAAVTWNNTVLKAPIWIGWMNNWQYGNMTPTESFRGMMSLPRTLKLVRKNGELFLSQKLFHVEKLHNRTVYDNHEFVLTKDNKINHKLSQDRLYITTNILENKSTVFSFQASSDQHSISIEFDLCAGEIRLNRKNCGDTSFAENFASVDIMPIDTIEDIEMIIDRTSIELFVNDGTRVMSELFFMPEKMNEIEWSTNEGKVIFSNYNLSYLKTLWN